MSTLEGVTMASDSRMFPEVGVAFCTAETDPAPKRNGFFGVVMGGAVRKGQRDGGEDP